MQLSFYPFIGYVVPIPVFFEIYDITQQFSDPALMNFYRDFTTSVSVMNHEVMLVWSLGQNLATIHLTAVFQRHSYHIIQ